MAIGAEWLERVLQARMPRASARARLELVAWSGKAGFAASTTGIAPVGGWACLQLTRDGAANGSTAICLLVLPKQLALPEARVEVYLEGWLSAIDHLLENAAPQVLALAMPANLACPSALDLARPRTPDEFRAAILAPRRLGKLLGDPAAAMRSLDAGRS